eukprot:UN06834
MEIKDSTFHIANLTLNFGAGGMGMSSKSGSSKQGGASMGEGSDMDKMNKEEFLSFCRKALADQRGSEFKTFYKSLFGHFMGADHNLDGYIDFDQFEDLVEASAANVRRLGLAPPTSKMYKTDEDRMAARRKMFDRMDARGTGRITFDEYVKYTLSHMKGKLGVSTVRSYADGEDIHKDEFVSRLKRAFEDPTGYCMKDLYKKLFGHFEAADHDRDGKVDFDQFEALIEASAKQVRRLGLAPPTEKMYKTPEERIAKRKKMFAAMDTDGNGTITFNEYLQFTLTHIKGKINFVEGSKVESTATEYVQFLKRALNNRNGDENKVFYRQMFAHFTKADHDLDGLVKLEDFDDLITAAAAKVRRLGLAPPTEKMYKMTRNVWHPERKRSLE